MKKYIQNLDDFIAYLEKLRYAQLLEWFSNYLLYDFTAPLAYMPMNQSSASFITQIFNNSKKFTFKLKIKKVIKDIYRSYPQDKYGDYPFVEILEIIGRLNIADLFPELWRDAFGEEFKDVPLIDYPDIVDLHTYILKSLFGISIEKKKNIRDVIKIIKRDISNPKYMLECFDILYLLPKNVDTALNYIPILLKQISTKKRDFEGSLNKYIQTLGMDSLSKYFPKIMNLIGHNREYVDRFVKIIKYNGYNIIDRENHIYLYLKTKIQLSDEISLAAIDYRNIDIIYSALYEPEMLEFCDMKPNEIITKIFPDTKSIENMDKLL